MAKEKSTRQRTSEIEGGIVQTLIDFELLTWEFVQNEAINLPGSPCALRQRVLADVDACRKHASDSSAELPSGLIAGVANPADTDQPIEFSPIPEGEFRWDKPIHDCLTILSERGIPLLSNKEELPQRMWTLLEPTDDAPHIRDAHWWFDKAHLPWRDDFSKEEMLASPDWKTWLHESPDLPGETRADKIERLVRIVTVERGCAVAVLSIMKSFWLGGSIKGDVAGFRISASSAAVPEGETEGLAPLTKNEKAVFDLIFAKPEGEAIQGPDIIQKLWEDGIGIEQSTLTKTIIPALKEKRGIKNLPRAGYFVPKAWRDRIA